MSHINPFTYLFFCLSPSLCKHQSIYRFFYQLNHFTWNSPTYSFTFQPTSTHSSTHPSPIYPTTFIHSIFYLFSLFYLSIYPFRIFYPDSTTSESISFLHFTYLPTYNPLLPSPFLHPPTLP